MKKLLSFILLIALVSAFGVFASADESLPSVVDDADLLTPSEERSLESKINAIREKYDFDVLVLTYSGYDGRSTEKIAEEFYLDNGYGLGKDRDGCVLFINIGGGEVAVSSYGSYGEYAFTEFGRDYILDKMYDETGISDGRYYDSAMLFVDRAEYYLECAAAGEPFDEKTDWPHVLIVSGIIALLAGLVVSAIYISSLKSQLKSVAPKLSADGYIDRSSLDLRVNKDTFLYSNVSKTPRPQNTSGGSRSGGGTRHTSSGSFHSSVRKL